MEQIVWKLIRFSAVEIFHKFVTVSSQGKEKANVIQRQLGGHISETISYLKKMAIKVTILVICWQLN